MPLTSAAALAVRLNLRPATLERAATGTYVGRKFVPAGPPVSTTVKACIQAAAERGLRVLPEGEWTDGYVTIWSLILLRTTDEDAQTQADVIRAGTGAGAGPSYRIVKVAERPEGGFWRALGRLVVDRGRSV